MDIKNLATRLADWYSREGRDFPWRRGVSAYGTWVCEVMSQQTQMSRVVPWWLAWMSRWPSPEALAQATDEQVTQQWRGLGYYSRARSLLAGAKQLVREGHSDIPDDESLIRSLKGVGPYTAAALLCLCFDHPVPPMDGNLRRVAARLSDESGTVGTAETDRRLNDFCAALMRYGRPSVLAQALMDLGAGPCSPSARCFSCPLTADCLAFKRGTVSRRPVVKKRPPIKRRFAAALVDLSDLGLALRRREPQGLWANFYEPPWLIGRDDESPELLAQLLARSLGMRILGDCLNTQTLRYTTWQVQVSFFPAEGATAPFERHPPSDLERLPLPAGLLRGLRICCKQ